MKVELIDFIPKDEKMLNLIARGSRKLHPGPEDMQNTDVFKKTVEWNHREIQRFAYYIFRVEDLSRVALQQLARYHFIALNVTSGRHITSPTIISPDDDGSFAGFMMDTIEIADAMFSHIPKEDRRFAYPCGLAVNLFMAMNGDELRHFLKQRLDKHAQWEIRALANKIYDLVHEVHPVILTNLK